MKDPTTRSDLTGLRCARLSLSGFELGSSHNTELHAEGPFVLKMERSWKPKRGCKL